MAVGEDVYCTLVLNDTYLPGAAVLAHSLRDASTSKKLAVLVTVDSLRYDTLTELKTLFDYVIPVDRVSNPNPANLYLIDRGDLLHAFTKINLWRQVQFRKIVYIDSDVVALRAVDELFETKEPFAAASDIGWPDLFNSGVMVLSPDMGTFWALQTLAASGDSFDGADQGLLNQYYEHKNWKRLPFTYNCTPSSSYQYEPAYRYHKSQISLVHFIGAGKPWQKGRYAKGVGAYGELLSRWWSVYDRHYKFSLPGVQYSPQSGVVQKLVKGEEYQNVTHSHPQPQQQSTQSQPPVITVEGPPTDPADRAEEILHENVEPTPTVEQRRFSAPQNEWDATRAPPPAQSHPEAVNFPTQTYDFNADPTPFQPPASYPEPPKDMWYEVPKEKPLPPTSKPKPIFPWEERQVARPSRIFAEDAYSQTSSTGQAATPDLTSTEVSRRESTDIQTPSTPTIRISDDANRTTEALPRNAWDDVAGINDYVRQLNEYQRLRGKLQVLKNEPRQALSPNNDQSSPPGQTAGVNAGDAANALAHAERRESLILTDFPSAWERPSLPVTPAPIRRNLFWGEERDEHGNLPEAEGVPTQAEWNPVAKLEELRKASLALDPSDLVLPAKNVPRRDMPRTSIDLGSHPALISTAAATSTGPPIVDEDEDDSPSSQVRFNSTQLESVTEEEDDGDGAFDNGITRKPVKFGQVKFGSSWSADRKDDAVSPTRR